MKVAPRLRSGWWLQKVATRAENSLTDEEKRYNIGILKS